METGLSNVILQAAAPQGSVRMLQQSTTMLLSMQDMVSAISVYGCVGVALQLFSLGTYIELI
jgi:hypothetical protein